LQSTLGKNHPFTQKVERFDAVDGAALMAASENDNEDSNLPCLLEWNATKNAMYDRHIQPPMAKRMAPGEVGCAMSHVQLWRELVNNGDEESSKNSRMLILEDDATLYRGKHQHKKPSTTRGGRGSSRGVHMGGRRHDNREGNKTDDLGFLAAFSSLWKVVPSDWDILYLGFSDRGERISVPHNCSVEKELSVEIHVFRPTYGFHTHAYALSKSAASILLSNLPVVGPLDVWLADNEWFGLKVYCGVVANEGWHDQGACLVTQRKHDTSSDIDQSGRTDEREDRQGRH
jgi:GR25 family glycosyltransferase involved in LPS biosynthesis